MKVRKMAKIRNQYNQVPHLAQDTTWVSNKITIRHHKQEPKDDDELEFNDASTLLGH